MNVVICLEGPVPGASTRAALTLAQTLGRGTTLIGLSATEAAGGEALQAAIGARCARAALVSDPVLQNGDYLSLATALAAAIRRLGADLVLMGTTGASEGTGAIPAAVARELGWAYLARGESVRVADGPDEALVEVRTSQRIATLRVPLPAVITVPSSAPPGRRRTRTNLTPPDIEILTLREIGIDPAELRRNDPLLGELQEWSGKPTSISSAQEMVAAIAARTPGGRG